MITAYESVCYLAGTEKDSGDVVLSKRDCVVLVELVTQLRTDARALWAVRVLDAWADEVPSRSWETRRADSSVDVRACCVLRHARIECHFGNFDSARHAAALAVFPSLSAAKRAELGECP